MNQKKFGRILRHYEKYFGRSEATQLHRVVFGDQVSDIAVVRFQENNEFPYQVLATIGASDHLIQGSGLNPHRCEYVTFVPADWNMANPRHSWVLEMLHLVSTHAASTHDPLTYGSTLNMEQQFGHLQNPDFNMIGAALLLPEAVPDPGILHCHTDASSSVIILQMMPITKDELEWHRTHENPYCFDRYFYPASSDEIRFLCARRR